MAQFVDINSLEHGSIDGSEKIQISATQYTTLQEIANLVNLSNYATKPELTSLSNRVSDIEDGSAEVITNINNSINDKANKVSFTNTTQTTITPQGGSVIHSSITNGTAVNISLQAGNFNQLNSACMVTTAYNTPVTISASGASVYITQLEPTGLTSGRKVYSIQYTISSDSTKVFYVSVGAYDVQS